MFFRIGKSFYGTSVHITTAILDLKKDGNSIFFCDDIYFSSLGCDVVRFYNLVVMFLEVVDGEKFCLVTKSPGRESHIYSTVTLLTSLILTSPFTLGL